MDRLTRRIETKFPRGIKKGIELDGMLNVYEDDVFYDIADKLAHYEDMEEQGRLIEVVRCSECEHYDTDGCADGCGWCDYWDIGRFTDGYCDKGKLKELEGDKE